MQQQANAMPKVVEDCHELLAWIISKLDQFPRNRRRFTLGEHIESGLLLVLEQLIRAAYQQAQLDSLKKLSLVKTGMAKQQELHR